MCSSEDLFHSSCFVDLPFVSLRSGFKVTCKLFHFGNVSFHLFRFNPFSIFQFCLKLILTIQFLNMCETVCSVPVGKIHRIFFRQHQRLFHHFLSITARNPYFIQILFITHINHCRYFHTKILFYVFAGLIWLNIVHSSLFQLSFAIPYPPSPALPAFPPLLSSPHCSLHSGYHLLPSISDFSTDGGEQFCVLFNSMTPVSIFL